MNEMHMDGMLFAPQVIEDADTLKNLEYAEILQDVIKGITVAWILSPLISHPEMLDTTRSLFTST